MSQNLLTAPKASSRARLRSRSLLRYGCIGFRFVRHKCSPWLVSAIALLKLVFASGAEWIHKQIRYFSAIARIDFVSVYGFLNDLLW